jgi:hypothetical protein
MAVSKWFHETVFYLCPECKAVEMHKVPILRFPPKFFKHKSFCKQHGVIQLSPKAMIGFTDDIDKIWNKKPWERRGNEKFVIDRGPVDNVIWLVPRNDK